MTTAISVELPQHMYSSLARGAAALCSHSPQHGSSVLHLECSHVLAVKNLNLSNCLACMLPQTQKVKAVDHTDLACNLQADA